MRRPFERRKAERLAREFDAGSLTSSEALAVGRVSGAFDRNAWPEKADWQRIHKQALAGDGVEQPATRRERPARRVGARVAYVGVGALTVAAVTGYMLLSQPRAGRQLPLTSGAAVAHEMLAELRQPGKVTHYVIEQTGTNQYPSVLRIDCWIDGERGIVKSTAQVTRTYRLTSVDRRGRVTTVTQQRRHRPGFGITNNYRYPPAWLLGDPMQGGIGRYLQMLRRGELTLVGTETVQGVATYKLRSDFAGQIPRFTRARVRTIIYARQDNFQPLFVTSDVELRTNTDQPIRQRGAHDTSVTEYVRTEVVDRASLPADFFDVRIPPKAEVWSDIGYSIEEAKRFESYPAYYAGDSLRGMPACEFSEEDWAHGFVPGGPSRSFNVFYGEEGNAGPYLFVSSFPGATDLRKVSNLAPGPRDRITKITLTGGILRGHRAVLRRDLPRHSRRGSADLFVVAPGSTVHVSGSSAALVLRAANSLRRLN